VHAPFAVLEFLARRPDGYASLDDCLQSTQAERASATLPDFGSLDLVEMGLVVAEDNGLRITEAGRSMLRALEASSDPPSKTAWVEHSQSLKLIDGLIGAKMREKIFDLELRSSGDSSEPQLSDHAENVEPEQAQPAPEIHWEDPSEPAQMADEPVDVGRDGSAAEENFSQVHPHTPSFLAREIGTARTAPVWTALPAPGRPALKTSNLKRLGGILRGHIEHDVPNVKPGDRGNRVSGLIVSILALLVVIICAGTVIAVTQIRSLTAEIATLEKKLLTVKSQVGSPEQQSRKSSSRQDEPAVAPAPDKGRFVAENRTSPALPSPQPLVLSPDEMRLIREYIKPAPSAGLATSPIKVGDPVTTGTIPLPSSLMDKLPRLLGGRFTIRNGTIVILRRDSRQADAVIGPN
jgi:hypothetical protein